MQEDSEQFDKVIKLRNDRDNENNIIVRSRLASESLQVQVIATEIPLEIAAHCIKLAGFAIEVFDQGFKSARGDSSVAINCAVSSIGGCLSIVDLNLLSFGMDDWTEQIRTEADLIKTVHSNLIAEATERQRVLNNEAEKTNSLHAELNALRLDIQKISKLTDSQIEVIARKLQNILWKHRALIWKNNIPSEPLEILKATKALGKLGYQFETVEELGSYSEQGIPFEIAGIIDSKQKYVSISARFAPEIRNFTTAHELGHALLHPGEVLHRDMPLDGSVGLRDPKEIHANKFAAYFLMPAKGLKSRFEELFSMKKFELNTDTANALGLRLTDLRKQCKVPRDLSRIVANTTVYKDKAFNSLARQFNVSIEAMAIRLEELNLISL